MSGLADLALLGHQESWARLTELVQALRGAAVSPLSDEDVRGLVPWIPPRTALRVTFSSTIPGRSVRASYVETFLAPEELAAGAFHRARSKVREALECAGREGARLAALGGFTSIVLEGRPERAQAPAGLALTTGNSLTAALICKGVEEAALRTGLELAAATVLVIGASGDVGSACARWLGRRAGRLLLCARNEARLERQAAALRGEGVDAAASVDLRALLSRADVVVCAASLTEAALDTVWCKPRALVCDAGYPKNVLPAPKGPDAPRVFWGGLGRCASLEFEDASGPALLPLCAPRVLNGCLLEGVALALEGRFDSFSEGRGRITEAKLEEIWSIASRHGITLAPLLGPGGVSVEEAAT